ncbi:phage tail protein [Salmonella enterica subsp. enterica serovar Kentucky]
MSSGCGDILTLNDLQIAKKHQLFEAEVITGKSGGVAGGEDIDYATNQVTLQTQKTLPAVLRDAGFHPVSWDFSTGGILGVNDRDKVVFDPVSKNWYSWLGALPHTVPALTNPVGDANWTPQTDPNLRLELSGSTPANIDSLIGGIAGKYSPPVKFIVVDRYPYNGNLKAALTAAVPGSVFWLGKATYNITGLYGANRNPVENISIVGAGMPQLSSDKSRFVEGSGTILQGSVKNGAKGFKIYNLGIDCGNYVSQSVYPSLTYEDGLQIYGAGDNANIEIFNLKTLNTVGLTDKPGTHSILLEQTTGITMGYVECIGGFHGLTIKCKKLRAGTATCYGQYGDAFIIKSDSGGMCADNYIERIIVGLYDNTGWPDVSLGGIYDAHDGVSIDRITIGELVVQNASWGLIPSVEGNGFISSLTIGKYSAYNVYGNYYSLVINAKAVGWAIGDHKIVNTSGGIRVDPSSVDIALGNGFSKGSTKSGYALGGNSLVHGTLIADSNGEYGVEYLGGVGLDASLVRGFTNQFGLISVVPSAKNGTPLNGWADNGEFDIQITGKRVTITGTLVRGTAAAAFNILNICQPRKRVPISAFGVNGSSTWVPVECYVEANGTLNVVGYDSIPSGGAISFSGSYLSK